MSYLFFLIEFDKEMRFVVEVVVVVVVIVVGSVV